MKLLLPGGIICLLMALLNLPYALEGYILNIGAFLGCSFVVIFSLYVIIKTSKV